MENIDKLINETQENRTAVNSVPQIESLLAETLARTTAFHEALPHLLGASQDAQSAYYDAYSMALRKHTKK